VHGACSWSAQEARSWRARARGWVHGRRAGALLDAREARGRAAGRAGGARARGARSWPERASGARGCARVCAAGRASERLRVHCSPESTIFARNEEINLK
ncbi:hypothetical protein CRG98_039262, partial [Punica granatum]